MEEVEAGLHREAALVVFMPTLGQFWLRELNPENLAESRTYFCAENLWSSVHVWAALVNNANIIPDNHLNVSLVSKKSVHFIV